MFPRRRPPLRRRPNRRPQQSKAQQILQHAHHLMENEEYAQAAKIFERLAYGARQRGMLRQAPRLFLQAGQAYLLSKNTEKGSELIWKSLKMLAHARRWPALQRTGQRVTGELIEHGYPELAQEIERWLQETLPENIEDIRQPGRFRQAKPPQLPLKCPSCGGPIRSDEVEWADATTAICPYCGSGLRDEKF